MVVVAVWWLKAVWLKIRGSHLTSKVTNKCLNVRQRAEVVERNEDGLVLSPAVQWLLLCLVLGLVSVWERKRWKKNALLKKGKIYLSLRIVCKKKGKRKRKETPAQVFFCEFCGIFTNTLFTEHLRTTSLNPNASFHLKWNVIF